MPEFSKFQLDCQDAINEMACRARVAVARSEFPDPVATAETGIRLAAGQYVLWLYEDGAQIDDGDRSHRFEIEGHASLDKLQERFLDVAHRLLLPFVGPHEGREFDLMIAGEKQLSMFIVASNEEFTDYPDPRFETLVANGRFVKNETIEQLVLPNGQKHAFRRILYAIADEAWRIPAMLMVQDLYVSLLPGRRADLERIIGTLLGYERADIEAFVAEITML